MQAHGGTAPIPHRTATIIVDKDAIDLEILDIREPCALIHAHTRDDWYLLLPLLRSPWCR
jgi:hypothetical protein